MNCEKRLILRNPITLRKAILRNNYIHFKAKIRSQFMVLE